MFLIEYLPTKLLRPANLLRPLPLHKLPMTIQVHPHILPHLLPGIPDAPINPIRPLQYRLLIQPSCTSYYGTFLRDYFLVTFVDFELVTDLKLEHLNRGEVLELLREARVSESDLEVVH